MSEPHADHTQAPADSFAPLRCAEDMAELIREVAGDSVQRVIERLVQEYKRPGSNVADDFARRGFTPYTWGRDMIDFYCQTDAFLYELALWNINPLKKKMRRWVRNWLSKHAGPSLNILSIGDGLGFDCLELAAAGHKVTYFEVEGYSASFAGKLFARMSRPIKVLTDVKQIPIGIFDAVICLDVLEHVPDPPGQLRDIHSYLKPAGVTVINAPFYLIHPAYPTHLRSNRRYNGNMRLYTNAGFKLIDGTGLWSPLVLAKTDADAPLPAAGSSLRRTMMRVASLYLMLGRFTAAPFLPFHYLHHACQTWFKKSPRP